MTFGLGNRCSILLSYGTAVHLLASRVRCLNGGTATGAQLLHLHHAAKGAICRALYVLHFLSC